MERDCYMANIHISESLLKIVLSTEKIPNTV